MANNSGLSKRAALRQQQEMEAQAARRRKILTGVISAVAVIALVVVSVIVVQALGKRAEVASEQLTPPNATDGNGINVLSKDVKPAPDAPHVVVYQDFQCPACKAREEGYGQIFEQLVDEGKITLEFRTAYFLDKEGPGDASKRASIAASAADEVGYYRAYHDAVFANQGGGFPESLLLEDIPKQIGMEGDDLRRFQELARARAFNDFADAQHETFMNSGYTGTPTYEVNGKELVFGNPQTQEVYIQPTPDDVMRAIEETANQG